MKGGNIWIRQKNLKSYGIYFDKCAIYPVSEKLHQIIFFSGIAGTLKHTPRSIEIESEVNLDKFNEKEQELIEEMGLLLKDIIKKELR